MKVSCSFLFKPPLGLCPQQPALPASWSSPHPLTLPPLSLQATVVLCSPVSLPPSCHCASSSPLSIFEEQRTCLLQYILDSVEGSLGMKNQVSLLQTSFYSLSHTQT